jgi:hypothetical protein
MAVIHMTHGATVPQATFGALGACFLPLADGMADPTPNRF